MELVWGEGHSIRTISTIIPSVTIWPGGGFSNQFHSCSEATVGCQLGHFDVVPILAQDEADMKGGRVRFKGGGT